MNQDRPGDALLRWAALVVPAVAGGIGWAATEGQSLPIRVAWGVAAGLAAYAAIYLVVKGFTRRDP
jgi:hypothetical protein